MKKLISTLSFWVILSLLLATIFALYCPAKARNIDFLGKYFIELIKMFIPYIIFLSISTGIANMDNIKKVGKTGLKSIIYFEIVTTFALACGLFIGLWLKPGNITLEKLQIQSTPIKVSQEINWVEFFKENIILQTLLFSILLGIFINIILQHKEKYQKLLFLSFRIISFLCFVMVCLNFTQTFFQIFLTNENDLKVQILWLLKAAFHISLTGYFLYYLYAKILGKSCLEILNRFTNLVFKILGYSMILAPIGAFGAISGMVGKFGVQSFLPLLKLILAVYVTMILFIVVFLGGILKIFFKTSIFKVLNKIKAEILLVFATSSSETALPKIMQNLESIGCSKAIVGLVIPTGYSFNLDGTSIYLSMSIIFLAQLYGVSLSFNHLLSIILILMLTSKGASGVTGSGFVVLASSISLIPQIPLEGLIFLLGIDKFMSEARAITNIIGNAVATICISKSEGDIVNI